MFGESINKIEIELKFEKTSGSMCTKFLTRIAEVGSAQNKLKLFIFDKEGKSG